MTRAVDRLSSRIEDLPEGTLRRRVLESARRFKSSWVELARLLSQVRSEELWREWSYARFERYCSEELFLRRQTAEKLTRSYGFLERPPLCASAPSAAHRPASHGHSSP